MPYAPEHKEQTRARIVECVRRTFNRHGFEAVASHARCDPATALDAAAGARQQVLRW